MYRQFFLVILVLFALSCDNNHNRNKNVETVKANWKRVPDSWIERVRHYTYKKPDTGIVSEFVELIKPDTISNSHVKHIDTDDDFIFNAVFVNLNDDQNNELICIQGWDIYDPYLCVFKQVNNKWYLIYKEEVSTFYDSPTIYVANNYSKNKTFYLRRVYDHGSGVYIDGYSFYKLSDNKVYKCLDIINDAHIEGWGLYMNQSVKSSFGFSGNATDDLSVDYSYDFFSGNIHTTDCPWCAHDDISLIKGEDNVDYIYNDKEHKYKIDIPQYKNSAEDLTTEKIACFGDFGDDSLFVKAFRRQIDTTIKIGTHVQKKILRKYLLLVQKNKMVTTRY